MKILFISFLQFIILLLIQKICRYQFWFVGNNILQKIVSITWKKTLKNYKYFFLENILL